MYHIICKSQCGEDTRAYTWFDVLDYNTDGEGWIRCDCGSLGCIRGSHNVKGAEKPWTYYVWALIRLNDPNEPYQPLMTLLSDEPSGPPSAVRFIYYAPTERGPKWGHGPGGPPVISIRCLFDETQWLKKQEKAGLVQSA